MVVCAVLLVLLALLSRACPAATKHVLKHGLLFIDSTSWWQRLEEENANLAKKQTTFQRSREHQDDAEEKFEEFCSKAMFRISILESRLQKHEETAIQKYTDLDEKLWKDPRLAILEAPVNH